jgi:hypothetical protein
MKNLIMSLALATSSLAAAARGAENSATTRETSNEKASTMKIQIKVGGKTLSATLADNPTSKDFVSLLPLTLTLKNYAATEKISNLPKRLSTQGAPAGCDPDVGDITYYAPWGNLAIFYKDFGYSDGLVKLGKIDGDVEVLKTSGALTATIEGEQR